MIPFSKIIKASYSVQQTILLYASQLIMTGFGAIAYFLMTKEMTKESFGDREVILKIVVFISAFVEFGVLTAGSRLLALQQDKTKERQLLSLLIALSLLLLTLLSTILFTISFFIDDWFQTIEPIGYLLALFSLPLSFIAFKQYFQLLYQGTNEILKLSFYNAAVQTLFLLLIGLLWSLNQLTTMSTIAVYAFAMSATAIFLIVKGRPSLGCLEDFKTQLLSEVKNYGAKFYAGRAVATLTQNLDSLLLALFFTSSTVGVYSVALFFVSPILMFSEAFLSVQFKKLSALNEIPSRLIWTNVGVLLGIGLGYVVLGQKVFEWIFPKYADDSSLIFPLILAMIFNGFSKPFNYFFASKGFGNTLLWVALIFTMSNIITNLYFIPKFAEIGAATAMLISVFIIFTTQLILYFVFIARERTTNLI